MGVCKTTYEYFERGNSLDWEVVHVKRLASPYRRPCESGQVMHSECTKVVSVGQFWLYRSHFHTVLRPKGVEGPGVVTEEAGEKDSMIGIESP